MKNSERKAESRRERIVVLALVVLALALRLLYHFEMRGNIRVEHLQLDEQFHHRWAKTMVAGDWVGKEVYFRAPLYPYVVAAVYVVSSNDVGTVRILQHLAGAAAVLLIYIMGRMLFGFRAAVIAALLAAGYAVVIHFEGRLLFDFPVAFLALLWLTLALRWSGRPSGLRFAALGFLFGLMCTMRPTFLPLAIPVFGYLLWFEVKQERLRLAAPLVLSFLVPVVFVTARNAIIGGDPVVIASQGGINFYIGNNPQADGMSSAVPDAGGLAWEPRQLEFIAQQSFGRPVRPSEVSRYWYSRGFAFVFDQPLAFLHLTLKKVYLFWSRIEIKNNLSFYSFERASSILKLLPVGFWLIGPLGIAGMVLAWKNYPRSRLLVVFIVSYMLVTVAFFVCDRFRLPIVPLLCVFSGFTVHYLVASWSERQLRELFLAAVPLTAGTLLVNTNFVQLRPEIEFGDEEVQALAALQSGAFATAAELYDKLATLNPENSGARINQGIALWGAGKMEDAARAFRAGIGANPYSGSLNLAHLFFNLHQMDSASLYAERAIAAGPVSPGGYVIAAKCLIVRQKLAEAQRVLLQGAKACGEEFVYGEYLLAGLYLDRGNLAAADSIYRKVLAQTAQPQQPDYMLESERTRFGEERSTVYGKSLHGIGRVFGLRGRLDSSEAYLRAAARQLPTRADIVGDWGVCLLRLKRLNEADSVMQRSLGLKPDNPAMWLNYGTVLAHKGELARARTAAARALALKQDFPEARRLFDVLSAQLSKERKKE
jgi:tetratricopeptide (TPR) repeat protein